MREREKKRRNMNKINFQISILNFASKDEEE
jgi:hypothetical protein